MNKFYNVIWNEAKQKYVVVSELVHSVKIPKAVVKGAIMGAVALPFSLSVAMAANLPVVTAQPVAYNTQDGVYGPVTDVDGRGDVKLPVYISTPTQAISAASASRVGITGDPIITAILIGKGANVSQKNAPTSVPRDSAVTGLAVGAIAIGTDATITLLDDSKMVNARIGAPTAIGYKTISKNNTDNHIIDYGTPGNRTYEDPVAGAVVNNRYNSKHDENGQLVNHQLAATTSLGAFTQASHTGTAVGTYANAGIDGGTAIGAFSNVASTGAVAVGVAAASRGTNSIAIGRQAAGAGTNGVAIGVASSALGDGGIAMGPQSTASGAQSIAIGTAMAKQVGGADYKDRTNATVAAADRSIVLGSKATSHVTADDVVVIGTGAFGNHKSAVAIGSASRTTDATAENEATVNGITYSGFKGEETIAAGGVETWSFSVGDAGKERQIKNVAPGKISADSTDAINGSQLYLTQEALGNVAKTTARNLGGNVQVNPDGTLSAPTYNVNVANPTAGNNANLVTTAPNVGDALNNLNTYVNQGFRVLDNNATEKGTVTPGEAIQFVNGQNTVATVKQEANGITTVSYDVTPYSFKVTAGQADAGTTSGTVEEKEVAKDAVVALKAGNNLDVKQEGTAFTYSLKPNITVDSVTITGGPVINNGGINMNNKPISNVGDGQAPKDAVNKSQLDAAKVSITANANEAANATTGPITLTSTSDANGTVYNIKVTPGTLNSAPGGKITPPAGPDANNLVNAGDVANAINALGDNTIKLGADGGTTTDGQALNKNGGLQFNVVTASDYLSTTAAGTDVTIDLTQDTKDKIDNAADKNLSNITPAGKNVIKDTAAWKLTANGNDESTIKGGDTVDIAQGNNIVVKKAANKITIETAKEVSFDNVSVGPVTINKDEGIDAGDTKITNLAPGTAPTDAVNKSQLDDAIDNYGFNVTSGKVGSGQSNGAAVQKVSKDNTVTFKAGNNLIIDQAEKDFTYSLNPVLTNLTGAEFNTPNGPTTSIGGNGVTINPPGKAPVSLTQDGLNNGDNKITNVAPGEAPTDAVNKSQLDAQRVDITANNGEVAGQTTGPVTLKKEAIPGGGFKYDVSIATAPITSDNGGNANTANPNNLVTAGDVTNAINSLGNNTIKLGADGQTTTDAQALNKDGGLQFNVVSGSDYLSTTAAGTDVTIDLTQETKDKIDNAADKNLSNITPAGKNVIKDTAAWKLTANGNDESTIKGGDTVDIAQGDNIVVTKEENKITIATAKEVSFENVTVGPVTINKDKGIDAGNTKITGVAPGEAPTDAVNVSQLEDAMETASYNFSVKSAADGGTLSGTQETKSVAKGSTVTFQSGKNLDLKQDGQVFTYSLVDDLNVNSLKVGKNGEDGQPAKDGVSITGPKDGEDGKVGISGKDGQDAVSISGKDGEGHIGLNGKDGASADITVKQGEPGVNGEPGTTMDRIAYTDKDGNPHEVATLDDGMKYAGDNGQNDATEVIKKRLNQQLDILGGADKDKLSDNNIGVNNEGGKLYVKLSKELQDLTSAEFKDGDNTTAINPAGVTITPAAPGKAPVSLTNNGLDNGGNKITNVAPGEAPTDAVNVSQLKNAAAAATTEVTANDGEAANQTKGNVTLTSKLGDKGQTIYDVKLSDKVTLGEGPNAVTMDGTTGEVKAGDVTMNTAGKGTINGLTNKTWDPNNFVSGQGATEDQLKAVDTKIDDTKNEINNTINNLGWNVTSGTEGSGTQSGTEAVEKVSNGNTVTFKAGNNLDVKQAGKDFTYSLKEDISVNAITANTVTAGKDGKDGKVAVAGKDGKDAVSISGKDGEGHIGLNGKDGASADITVKEGQPGVNGQPGTAMTRIEYKDKDGQPHEIATLDDGLKFVGDDGKVIAKPLNSTMEFVGGADKASLTENNIGVNYKDGKLAVQLAKDIKGVDSIGGGNTSISFGDSLKVNGGNLDMGGNKITNLAPGVDAGDAVNVSQLENGLTNVMNFGTREAARAGSHAGAMAALKPLQYDPLEPTQIMGGLAHYKGETAAAVGLAHFTHENTMFHVGVSVGHGDNMVAGGVSHKFGWSPEKKAVPERYQGGPISSVYVMQDEVTALRQENMKQQARIENQERDIQELRAMLAQVLASK